MKEEGLDYIVIGTLYECINCGRRMDKPDVVHKCITCGKLFNYKDAVYDALFRFKVTEKGYITYIEGVLKSEVVPQLLRELGLRAEVNAKLKGLSGVEHLVSIAGWRNGDLICIVDFSHPGRELREEVLSEVIKYLDLRPRVLALVVPKATEEEVFFARSQNIALVPLSEVEDKLRDLISSALQA